jgi:tRNA A37 threonylcarbamoyladenosine dehydratase
VGHITLIDSDAVCVTNINRQTQALTSTVGEDKVTVLQKRLHDINPACEIVPHISVFSKETQSQFGIENAGYVIDAIDSLTNKLDLIEYASSLGVKIFSCMGTAQKLDPTRLKIADIWNTQCCPLASLVRKGLRQRGFAGHFTCVYSAEQIPLRPESAGSVSCGTADCFCVKKNRAGIDWCMSKKVINGSSMPVTASAGMILASLVVRDVVNGSA